MELSTLNQTIDRVLREYESEQERLTFLQAELERKQKERDDLLPQLELFEEVRIFLQTLAEATRDEIMSGLQQVVTLCLQAVFGPNYSFEIEVETKRNNTNVEFYVVKEVGGQLIRQRPVGNMGGGVLDTIGNGLRFGLLKVINPMPDGPMILDEPAKMVSGDRIDSIAQLLKELTAMFDKQTIMVSHHVSLLEVVDNAIYVRNEDGKSIIEQ